MGFYIIVILKAKDVNEEVSGKYFVCINLTAYIMFLFTIKTMHV